MNPPCAKCNKTVYPIELLRCLDKSWHKGCFRCTTCNLKLTMNNYKGYDKMPYCTTHYPTTKFTAVADTPENMRIHKNTMIQSNIHYHSDYEQSKDKIKAIVDTPVMQTHLKNTKNLSAVHYHAEFEKQKGSKVSVADDPETARIKQNTQNQSNVAYWGIRGQRSEQEKKRPNEVTDEVAIRKSNPGKISDYDPAGEDHYPSPYSQRSSAHVVYDSQRGEVQSHRVQPGSIADYDPMNDRHSSIVGGNAPYQPPPQMEPPRAAQPPAVHHQPSYRALYDYNAADSDEVSFIELDEITNVQIIDEGWMTGTVKRTGQHGMLPSNYVELIK